MGQIRFRFVLRVRSGSVFFSLKVGSGSTRSRIRNPSTKKGERGERTPGPGTKVFVMYAYQRAHVCFLFQYIFQGPSREIITFFLNCILTPEIYFQFKVPDKDMREEKLGRP